MSKERRERDSGGQLGLFRDGPSARRPGEGSIRIGTGGWTYAPWRGTFYPQGLVQKRELAYAGSKLSSIEINGTYYGPQKPETFARWRDETPEGFVFSLKAPRTVTDRRLLASAGESVERFLEGGLLELQEKLGVIVWQLLPSKHFDPKDLTAFLRFLPKEIEGRRLRHAVEARHESFRHPDFIALLREHGVAVVVAGDSKHPQFADVTADFVYARLMGTAEGEAAGYPEAALDTWPSGPGDGPPARSPPGFGRSAIRRPTAPGATSSST